MTNKKWKQFGKFYLIEIVFLIIISWVANYGDESNLGLIELLTAFFLIILAGFMIGFFRWNRLLSFNEKLLPLLILVIVHFLITFSINYFDFFDRGNPTLEELKKGVIVTIIFDAVVFLISLPVIYLSKNRVITVANTRT
jgi:hypothetical protein